MARSSIVAVAQVGVTFVAQEVLGDIRDAAQLAKLSLPQAAASHVPPPPHHPLSLSPECCVDGDYLHFYEAASTMNSALSTRVVQRFRLVTSILVLGIGNYELWRIHKGIHPYWTPRLEEAGIVRQRNKLAEDGSIKQEAVATEKSAPKTWIKWTDLNGVPIPTLENSIQPTRKN